MAENNVLNKEQSDSLLINKAVGDPFINFQISSVDEFVIGVDDTDADSFKINLAGTSPSAGTNAWKMPTTGERTMAVQPCFCAGNETARLNVTGDGTAYDCIFESEVVDQGADYAVGTGIFTAPTTANYIFGAEVKTEDNTAAFTYEYLKIITSDQTYDHALVPAKTFQVAGGGGECYLGVTTTTPMDAADTAYIELTVQGGTLIIDVAVDTQHTYFYGGLSC